MDSFDSSNEEHENSIENFINYKQEIEKLIERLVDKTGMSEEIIRQFVNECELENAVDIDACVEEKIKNELEQQQKNITNQEGPAPDKPEPEEQDTDEPKPEKKDVDVPDEKKSRPRRRLR
ncbi:hypothetical protein [Vibrio sp. THAF190c]|uniref:hypothetical protein n=1 Tax=Vibrio sp. THAF190c TaxID=2587865 RepID=UPI001269822D|nr:hypothetical protein [Vibrio sp. THAF190c]QFT09692.1 hypothetical protein FIV04_06890 [Vibrio sp. THAF190c]